VARRGATSERPGWSNAVRAALAQGTAASNQIFLVVDAGSAVEVQILGYGSLIAVSMRTDFRFDWEFS
jgi:hypothetical protein